MNVSSELKKNVNVMTIAGRLDASNSENYKQELEKGLNGSLKVVLDLDGLEFIDSSGMGVLVYILKKVRSEDGMVLVTNLNYKTRLVFEITRANMLFDIFDSVDSAVDSMAA